jgi:hypothetical protein
MSIEELQNQKFRDVMSIRLYYDWHTYVVFCVAGDRNN